MSDRVYLAGPDRRMQFGSLLRTRLDDWHEGGDSEHRLFAQRLLRAFGGRLSDYIPFGD